MSKKIELLKQLLERIKTQGVIQDAYREENEDGTCSYCAVGHLMDLAGMDMSFVNEIYDKVYDTGFLTTSRNYQFISEFTEDELKPLLDAGFTKRELQELQLINDDSEADTINELENYIVQLINEA